MEEVKQFFLAEHISPSPGEGRKLYLKGLQTVAEKGHVEVCRFLLGIEGSSTSSIDKDGFNILHQAARNGHFDVVELLLKLEKTRKLVRYVDNSGMTPFHHAVQYGDLDIFDEFLKVEEVWIKGFVNRADKMGMTPLHHAAEQLDEDMVLALLEIRYVDHEQKTANGKTPLDLARSGNQEIKAYPHVVKILEEFKRPEEQN